MRSVCCLLFLVSASGVCPAAVITLNNQGFELGDTSGWTATGLVSAEGTTTIDSWTVGPNGSYMAVLGAGDGEGAIPVGGPVSSLETFFGVSAGLLSSGLPPSGEATVGSGIYQDFTGSAGDTVTMYWAYVATDYADFNDPAFAVVTGPGGVEQLTVLASIWDGGITVGDFGATGWHAFTYILPADGTYRLGFGVVNTRDDFVPGYLMLDNGPGSLNGAGGEIPEPATFALLGAGLLALGVLRRR